MIGKYLKQINNLKITVYRQMFYVYDPNGKELYCNNNAQEVRKFCENCKQFTIK